MARQRTLVGTSEAALLVTRLSAGMGNVFTASSAGLEFLAAEAAVLFRQVAVRLLTARTSPSSRLLVVALERPARNATLIRLSVEVEHVETLRTRPEPMVGEDRLAADHALVRLALQLLRQAICKDILFHFILIKIIA